MTGPIWVLGATGRSGRAIAALLHRAGQDVVLAGRDGDRLDGLAHALGGTVATRRADDLDTMIAGLVAAAPAVVVNTVGPFARTAARVARACPPGTHYVDIGNERGAVAALLDLHDEVLAAGRTVVPGAGFGVLAAETALLHVLRDAPPPARVRVDAMAAVVAEPGPVGAALAGSIVGGLAAGGRRYRDGRLVPALPGSDAQRLTTPDGTVLRTGNAPTAELEMARRVSGAPDVVSASSQVPTAGPARALLPVAGALARVPVLRRALVGVTARVRLPAGSPTAPRSWAHARAEWDTGEVREGWLRAGDGMDFTAAAAAATARRLAAGDGRPGAFTPGSLFGPDLATAAGGELVPT